MPRTRPRTSAIRQPLAYALGTPARVAALRALAGSGAPITLRELARRAGVSHRSIQLAVDDLASLALVTRIEGGRDHLVALSKQHRLAPSLQTLFTAEAEHFVELRREIAVRANALARRTHLVSVVLFGSVARGADTLASDCDLLVIARDVAGLDAALTGFSDAAPALEGVFGARLRPIGYVRADAARRWRARAAPFGDITRDAITVFGAPIAEVFHASR